MSQATQSAMPPTKAADLQIQAAVLRLLLDDGPVQMTQDELVRELALNPNSFIDRDDVQRAVRDLAARGLVHRHGEFVLASRSGSHAGELFER